MRYEHGSSGWYGGLRPTAGSPLEQRVEPWELHSPGAEYVELRPPSPQPAEPFFDARFSHLPPSHAYADEHSFRRPYEGYQPSDSYFDPTRSSLWHDERHFGPPIQEPEPERPPQGVYFLLTPERFERLMRDALQQATTEAQHPFPTDVDFPP